MATQIAMGPWFVRDDKIPFAPGCSYAIIKRKAQTGKLTEQSIIRGPSTHQFWMHADQVQGIAHLLGRCHQCSCKVMPTYRQCPECHASFDIHDRQNELGLQYTTPDAIQQARIQLEQLKTGQAPQPMPAAPAPSPKPANDKLQSVTGISVPSQSPPARIDATIGMVQPVASTIPLPDTSSILGHDALMVPELTDQPTSSLKTADLNRQAQKLSMTVIIMIVCIVVLLALILMFYLGSQKPGGVTGMSPIKRELGTTGALREETLPKVTTPDDVRPAQLPDPVGSLDMLTVISDARQLEQQGKSDQALAKLQEYARTLGDAKLPYDLETELKRIEQKITREKAASFFRSSN